MGRRHSATPTGTSGHAGGTPEGAETRSDLALRQLSAAFVLVFLGAGAFQQFIGPYLLATYHLGAGAASAVLATIYLVAFVCLTFTSYSMAWLGEYTALVLSTLAYGVFGAVALVTGNIAVLVPAAALWGWGASVLWTAGTAFALDLAGPGAYGRASGALYTGVFIGQALGVALLGTLEGWVGPRGMVAYVIGVTLLGTAVALFLPRRRQPRARPRLLNPLSVLSTSATRLAALILFLSSSGFGLLLGAFGQTVGAIYGLAAVGWITAGFYVARIPAGTAGGWLIDRLGRQPVLCAVLLGSAVALLLAAALQHPLVFLICAAVLGVQAAVVPVGLTAWVGHRAEAADRPSTFAAIQMWFNMGTGLAILGGPQMLSILGGWRGSFTFFAAIFLACTALASRLG